MAGLKSIVASFRLRHLVRRHSGTVINLPLDLLSTRNIMVCLPADQKELTMIKQFLPEISRIFADCEIYLLAAPGSQVYGIFPRKGYRIMTPSTDHLSWSGLAKKNYISALKKNKYDLILDLNLNPNQFVQSVLLSFPEAVRIGGCSSLGHPYYNFEIRSKFLRDEKNIYKSIIEMIGQFRTETPARPDKNHN